ncbi:hypothetical protein I4U23_011150 [Adineta vaga]|nr:hypothetical protein I4U23_011150 [Adineta vaga]
MVIILSSVQLLVTIGLLFSNLCQGSLENDFIQKRGAKANIIHKLKPADIKHVGGMGDSYTAAIDSWSVGGDGTLVTSITLPNILKMFNPNVNGFSSKTGKGFNVAQGGSPSKSLLGQAKKLVSEMKLKLSSVQFQSDWKIVTILHGGVDLLNYLTDINGFSVNNYISNLKIALEYLRDNLPRTLVNLVTVQNVVDVANDMISDPKCKSASGTQVFAAVPTILKNVVRQVAINFQTASKQLVDSGIFDTKLDFTVVSQALMEKQGVPKASDGSIDGTYFSNDCIHYSKKGHETAAIELWNNMMQKVGSKTDHWTMRTELRCPSDDGYIYTSKNSV